MSLTSPLSLICFLTHSFFYFLRFNLPIPLYAPRTFSNGGNSADRVDITEIMKCDHHGQERKDAVGFASMSDSECASGMPSTSILKTSCKWVPAKGRCLVSNADIVAKLGPKLGPLKGMYEKRARCDQYTSKDTCLNPANAADDCRWTEYDEEDTTTMLCDTGKDYEEVGEMIDYASNAGLDGWVRDFLQTFSSCGNHCEDGFSISACRDACEAPANNEFCEYVPPITGVTDNGACAPNLHKAIPLAICDKPECATAITTLVHAAIVCETYLDETSCVGSAKHPKYTCEWTCGMCHPAKDDYFPSSTGNTNTCPAPAGNPTGAPGTTADPSAGSGSGNNNSTNSTPAPTTSGAAHSSVVSMLAVFFSFFIGN